LRRAGAPTCRQSDQYRGWTSSWCLTCSFPILPNRRHHLVRDTRARARRTSTAQRYLVPSLDPTSAFPKRPDRAGVGSSIIPVFLRLAICECRQIRVLRHCGAISLAAQPRFDRFPFPARHSRHKHCRRQFLTINHPVPCVRRNAQLGRANLARNESWRSGWQVQISFARRHR
jgi:hypothetical protein